MRKRTPAERFFAKVQKTDTCWLWTGAAQPLGYGRFKQESYKAVGAHRWSYEYHVGPIPEGLTIDHLCRVPACVNPSHLEPVTLAENVRRIPRSTHCPSGHEYTPENTGISSWAAKGWSGRNCRECDRLRALEYRQTKLAPVPIEENMRRAAASGRTHCKQGHEYTAENTYWRKTGGRQCRTCSNNQTRAYRDRRSQGVAS